MDIVKKALPAVGDGACGPHGPNRAISWLSSHVLSALDRTWVPLMLSQSPHNASVTPAMVTSYEIERTPPAHAAQTGSQRQSGSMAILPSPNRMVPSLNWIVILRAIVTSMDSGPVGLVFRRHDKYVSGLDLDCISRDSPVGHY